MKPKIRKTKTNDALMTKIEDGFWCSKKFKDFIKKQMPLKNTEYPWFGKEIYSDSGIDSQKAFVVENGIVTEVYDVDWGLH